MLVIASLFPQLGDFVDLSQIIHLTPTVRLGDSIPTKVAKLGLALEEQLGSAVSDRALLLWSQYEIPNIGAVIANMRPFHRDQVMLPTLDLQQTVGWAAGHSVAVIRLAAVAQEADTMDWNPWPHHMTKRDITANITWWAQRINLRIYEGSR
jgi:hypothetical protein